VSYLRFILFVGGITVAIGASAKLSPKALDRLQAPPIVITDETGEVDESDEPEGLDGAAATDTGDTESAASETMASESGLAAEERSQWPDTFPVFVLGMLMATAGVVLWRFELRQERKKRTAEARGIQPDSAELGAERPDPIQLTLEGIPTLDQLVVDAEQLRGWEIMRRVDQFLETFVLPTVERRQEVMNRYGTAGGAELLIALAYGERMLNRTWSAAADGHLPEARGCLPEAAEGFHEVRRLFEQAARKA
jgi:hypothetical protein